jgi:hypothetical protein
MGGSIVPAPLLLHNTQIERCPSRPKGRASGRKCCRLPHPTSATNPGLLRGSEEIWGAWKMKQRDLRTHIIREWDTWLQSHAIQPGTATGRDSLKFYFELQDKRSTLLNFQSRGRDKWQIVHSWLLSEHRVND